MWEISMWIGIGILVLDAAFLTFKYYQVKDEL